MKTTEKLDKLTLSIRMTNQAKILSGEINQISLMIDTLYEARLRLKFRIEHLIREAHNLQREVIPITVCKPIQEPKTTKIIRYKGEVDENTLVEIFGEERAKELAAEYEAEQNN